MPHNNKHLISDVVVFEGLVYCKCLISNRGFGVTFFYLMLYLPLPAVTETLPQRATPFTIEDVEEEQ